MPPKTPDWRMWMLSTLLGLTGALGSYAMVGADRRLTDAEVRITSVQNRLTATETIYPMLNERLDRLEGKVDRLLELQTRRR